ncbi:fluoride efflux transporter CrcB [Nocardia terpenica]|uniref:fluoride efflux transporter CrcB n=1 Tax=Nocardia terpenica TaxID=455432 RepID=UPI0018958388|nr:fluoride efflux transporter CrcB [Nocardia terpenica]MBF6066128.1 fluoride efflux transporter CrcB [Nocardia terpenica]MBF6109181.1 fluoride efflux transporter CrcB [Nocardia terpenica]MBF6116372.1 fluoride efflux transporter CrcB [Nocardia terpenica]MBF6123529.1 fluoride efflux transporter CrcB [Nocardia terpenica]MBF6156806.1 fluoride efflux transporter CrcB [Nocardia terpenica]
MPETRLGGPVDPDVDLRLPDQRPELFRDHGAVLAVIALGGGLGAVARYGIANLLPTRPGHFPWGTFITNVAGCFAIGVLMVLITEVWSAHRLVRPFLGVGFLGGFTTFSTYAVDTRNLLQPGTAATAFAYLAGTLLCAMLAVIAGGALTRTAFLRNGTRRSRR